MKVLSIANQKGGVGKSSLTLIIAAALSGTHKRRILVIDTDFQESIAKTRSADREDGIPLPC